MRVRWTTGRLGFLSWIFFSRITLLAVGCEQPNRFAYHVIV
ncbi:hypothetical protein JCM19237_271 [Photobacterium aphoticum]|uniref:Uncharacterized protein n=1 Tax=Photobacterium aphoticum TaxID=754436 RepID=A0A090QYE3_9GAMM|nr:hypothetical protein JCM19237_271 [Photobacterium aphoticum]